MLRFVALLAFLLGGVVPSRAALVLIVDVTDPAAVTFTPGPDFASANSSGWDDLGTAGFTLLDFFANSANIVNFPGSGNLVPRGFTSDGGWRVDNGFFDPEGLRIFAFGSGTADIITTAPAFTGFTTFDFSSIIGSKPFNTLGVERGIQGGWFSPIGPVFGNYVMVAIPEPSTYIAIGGLIGLASFVGFRRRKTVRRVKA